MGRRRWVLRATSEPLSCANSPRRVGRLPGTTNAPRDGRRQAMTTVVSTAATDASGRLPREASDAVGHRLAEPHHRRAQGRLMPSVTGVRYTIKSPSARRGNCLRCPRRGVVRRFRRGAAPGASPPAAPPVRCRRPAHLSGASSGLPWPLERMQTQRSQIGPFARLLGLLAAPRDAPRHPARRSARHSRPPRPRQLFATSQVRPSWRPRARPQ